MPLDSHTSTDSLSAAKYVGEKVSAYLKKVAPTPILLFLSGGSAQNVFKYIALDDWHHVTITLMDERFGEDELHTNSCQLQKTDWFRQVKNQGGTFLSPLNKNLKTALDTVQTFEEHLRHWDTEHPDGKMVGLFGIGVDGHTAGILPFPENQLLFTQLFSADAWAVSYDASGKNEFPHRITTTFTLHRKMNAAFAYIVGEEKQEIFHRLSQGTTPLNEFPAQIFHSLPITVSTTLHP